MGIVLSKYANKPITTNYDISGAAVAPRNILLADAPIVKAEYSQAMCPTVLDRTKFIFNNELLCDVKFSVPAPSGERLVIPASKFILAISSPVFCAMFMVQWRRPEALLTCLSLSTIACWSYFVSCIVRKLISAKEM